MGDERTAGDGRGPPADGLVRVRASVPGTELLLVIVVALAVATTASAAAAPTADLQRVDLDAASSPAAADGADANVTIAATSVNASSVGVGEPVGVLVELENDGTDRGHHTARLTADGRYVTGVRARLRPGANRSVTLVARFDRPGTYRLAVDGRTVGNVTVTAADESVRLTDVSIDRERVELGAATTVTGRFVNDGDAPATETVTLAVDGEAVANRTVRLDPGERTVVSVEHSFERPGEYAISLDGQRAGTVVAAADGNASEAASGGSGDGNGAGGSLLMLAVGALVVLVVVSAVYAWVAGGGLADADDGGDAGPEIESNGSGHDGKDGDADDVATGAGGDDVAPPVASEGVEATDGSDGIDDAPAGAEQFGAGDETERPAEDREESETGE